MLSVARSLCVNAESNAVQRGRSLMRRYASYVMSSMRTALGGTLHPRESERERERGATGRSCRTAESMHSESLCAPPCYAARVASKAAAQLHFANYWRIAANFRPALPAEFRGHRGKHRADRLPAEWNSSGYRSPCGQLGQAILPRHHPVPRERGRDRNFRVCRPSVFRFEINWEEPPRGVSPTG